jgi:hypothetical protein
MDEDRDDETHTRCSACRRFPIRSHLCAGCGGRSAGFTRGAHAAMDGRPRDGAGRKAVRDEGRPWTDSRSGKLWAPFEAAVKDAAKSRIDAIGEMMRMRSQGERLSPVDHLEAMADRLSQGATNIKKIADAAKPLCDGLDESQKHRFGMLGRMLMPERARFAMDMMHHRMGDHDRDGDE